MFEFTWDVDPVLVQLGPVAIRYYGLIFLCVFLGGYALFRWQVLRGGGNEDEAAGIFIPAILGVLIGARLGHVLFYELGKAIENPWWILQVWKGGLSSHGATIGLLVDIYVYGRIHKQSYLESLDRFSISCALGATLVRAGNFVNSEIVGRVTDRTWGVRFPRYDHKLVEAGLEVPLRHPSQLYEVILGLSVMGILWVTDRVMGLERRPRMVMIAMFFAAYFTGRFFVEFWKEYQTLTPGFALTMGQILSIPAAAAGYFGVWWSIKHGQPCHWNVAAAEPTRKKGKAPGAARRRKGRK